MAVITGTIANDTLNGTAGNDTITGNAGNDFLSGGAGNDTLTGGDGDDQVFGESGNDLMVWNPGDDTDLFEGGADTDTALVNGGNGAEVFIVTANGTRVRFDRLDPDPFSLDIGTTEHLVLKTGGGNDSFSATGNLAALIQLTVDGGTGNDTILGSNAADLLLGGTGNDFIDGQQGNDVAFLGAGNDTFQWDPGDGNDTVEGGAGTDTLRFNASAGAEIFNIAANGGRGQVFRNVGNVTMDLNDVERIQLQALGGTDTIIVNDLTGTDLKLVAVDLAGAIPGTGDSAIDAVHVYGSNASNTINVAQAGGLISVTGLPAQVTLANADANDRLHVNGQGGNDKISAATMAVDVVQIALDGGAGNDSLTGGLGNDSLIGGDGNDTVIGGNGEDQVDLGSGNDLFVWNPGNGNDKIEGQDGIDTLRFIGSNASEAFNIFANGTRATVTRDIGAVVMDLNGVERIEVRALGSDDAVYVNDLTGTGVSAVVVDLAATSGGAAADTITDNVFIEGTLNDDSIKIGSVGSKIVTSGLAAQVTVDHAGKADFLVLNGGAGNDTIDAAKLPAGKVTLQLLGGAGADSLIGSAGNDIVSGGAGNDLAFLGAGNDLFVWNPGDGSDTIEGQAGTDTLHFNGNAGNEIFDISANGGRALLARNVGNVVMDLNDVERIELQASGGLDTIAVNNPAGTDLKQVAIDLAGAAPGTGDASVDAVVVNATGGKDTINVALTGGLVAVSGLSAQVTIANSEAANDRLTVNGFGGDDTINASKLLAGVIGVTLDGGIGNDTLVGSLGVDFLVGGDGNDTVAGDDGSDTAFLGAGNDLFLWTLGDGSDTIEGQADIDTLRFTGVNAGDAFNVVANGARTQVVASDGAVMDADDVERIEIRTLGGGDAVFVQNLAGTDVTEVAIDLAATAGGKTADAVIDSVVVNNGAGATMAVTSIGSKMVVTNNSTGQIVTVDHWGRQDSLVLGGSDGDDVLNASLVAAGKMNLKFLGGVGDDIIVGSAGNDTVTGGDGSDTAFLGAGNDLFVWNPGDDNDTIEGQAGTDTLRFNGGGVSENIEIFANGGRALLFRDIANVLMDMNDVERIELQALGGLDKIVVNDLSGTDVKQIAIDLAAALGGATGDGQLDTVTATGTAGKDVVKLALVGGAVSITGFSAQVTVAHADDFDLFQVNTLGGNDSITASTLKASSGLLSLDGGAGNDTITGGAGHDFLFGGDDNDRILGGGGNDQLSGGNGNDALDGGIGNDALVGGAGNDTLTGGAGNDTITGGAGNDAVTVSLGNDVVRYTSALDGHDVIIGFDGNPAGGQDTLDLDQLFDGLGVLAADRASRVLVFDKGASVDVFINADGNILNGFELTVATLKTADVITIGSDILVGT
jgi:Ca2+-binding RTX toxin-like protein